MDDLETRVTDLQDSLSEFKPAHPLNWAMGVMFNAVLAAAKEQLPGDPILADLEPAKKTSMGETTYDAGTMRAVLQQIQSALGNTGPASFVG